MVPGWAHENGACVMTATISPARAHDNGPKQSAWLGTEASMVETAQMKVAETGKSISAIAVDRLESKRRTLESGDQTGYRFLRFLMRKGGIEYRVKSAGWLGH